MAWAECPFAVDESPSGYHLYPDMGIFEVVRSQDCIVVPEGEPGEIVFTPLDARGTVVLRYRTATLSRRLGLLTLPPLRSHRPRLLGKISRNSEIKSMQIDKLKGTLVDSTAEHVLDDAPSIDAWSSKSAVQRRPNGTDELVPARA